MFKQFKQRLQQRIAEMIKDAVVLYVVNIEKDVMWETYLNAFREEDRQGHTCNSCRQFIKWFGNVVAIKDNKMVSIWDFDYDDPEYTGVPDQMSMLIHSGTIKDVFVTKYPKIGTDSNKAISDPLVTGSTVTTWEHLYYQLPKALVSTSSLSEEAVMSTYRDARNVFYRSLTEISLYAIDTTLELIAQNSLYRGQESKPTLDAFRTFKVQFDALQKPEEKELYAWSKSSSGSFSVNKIRNSAIGTLLTDITEGKDLDIAVSAFERIMAPANYKRPTAIVSKRMIEDAEKTVKELGIESSLGRRFAIPSDVTVNNVIFVDRTTKPSASDVFSQLKGDVAVNPKSFSKLEEVSINDFLTKVLPKANSIEVLLENQHSGNLVSLIAPQDPEAPVLFKWDNNFSWSYQNALADSMKERVKAAGGKVDGVLRCSLQWNEDGRSICDLDLHCIQPSGPEVDFRNKQNLLDVDMIRPAGIGVENIIYPSYSKLSYGVYRFIVHNYDGGHNTGFSVEIEFDGEVHSFNYDKKAMGNVQVAEVTYSASGFSIKSLLPSTQSGAASRKVWGMNTNNFQKVTMIMKSPNYWDDKKVGNEHTFFMLDTAHNDDTVRGFFNEFLKQDLEKHRKVFEVLGSKMKVEPANKQLSGLGFSSTTKGELITKVTGTFSRIIRIKF